MLKAGLSRQSRKWHTPRPRVGHWLKTPFWRPGAPGALGAGPQLVQTPWWKGGEWSGHPPLPPSPQVLVHVLCVMLFHALSCINYVAGRRDCFQAVLLGPGNRILFGLPGRGSSLPRQPGAGCAAVSRHTSRVETKRTPHKWNQSLKSRYPIKPAQFSDQTISLKGTTTSHFTVSSLLATARLRWNRRAGTGGIYGQ